MGRGERAIALLLVGATAVMLLLVVAELGGMFGPVEWTAVLAFALIIVALGYRLGRRAP